MITAATHVGRRIANEDKYVAALVSGGTMLAVMDGHGGVDTARYLANNIVRVWNDRYPHDDFETSLRNLVFDLQETTNYDETGSTLSVVILPHGEKVAHVAVVGDSPVIVNMNARSGLWIGPDHNVRTNESETIAAVSRGGIVSGGYLFTEFDGPGLQMTRAFGDARLGSVLDRSPEVHTVPLGSFILIGSDGLFDPCHGTAAVKTMAEKFAIEIERGCDANFLVGLMSRHAADNVTAVLWKRDVNFIGADLATGPDRMVVTPL